MLGYPGVPETDSIHPVAKDRCDVVLKLLSTSCAGYRVCITGEVEAAGHMRRYLLQQNPDMHMLPSMQTFNTVHDAFAASDLFQNGMNTDGTSACLVSSSLTNITSMDICLGYLGLNVPPNHIVVVTSPFHVPRAKFIFHHGLFKHLNVKCEVLGDTCGLKGTIQITYVSLCLLDIMLVVGI